MSNDTNERAKEFVLKDSVEIEGITENYIWYNAELLKQRMKGWMLDFEKVVAVMEQRHKEHIKMLQEVMEENRELKKKLKEKNT